MSENQQAVAALIQFIAVSRSRGMSERDIHDQLVAIGLSDSQAIIAREAVPTSERVVAQGYSHSSGEGTGDIVFGLVLILLGAVITAVTYSAASRGGGHYFVMTGFFIAGILRIIRGVRRNQ